MTAMRIGNREFSRQEAPYLLAVINVTPDSFFSESRLTKPDALAEQALRFEQEGADLIDIGGESTRPGSTPISLQQELDRVIPAIIAIRKVTDIPISIDTTKAIVAEAAIANGANLINDISAFGHDPRMIDVARKSGVACCLMHMQGTPDTMQQNPHYTEVVTEVRDHLLERARFAEDAGIAPEKIILDPGIGFGKTTQHNLKLIRDFAKSVNNRYPVLIGHSRKRFIGTLLNQDAPEDRLFGTLGASLAAYSCGATFLRVHDVAATRELFTVFKSIMRGEP